jgi:DNA-binding PadR family transcriptional regulator
MKLAVMKVEKGEVIVASLVSGHIEGTGWYKLLAKKKKDGLIEWAHFTERDNGLKENVYRGEVRGSDELQHVMEIMNRHLKRIFGEHAEMKQGICTATRI